MPIEITINKKKLLQNKSPLLGTTLLIMPIICVCVCVCVCV